MKRIALDESAERVNTQLVNELNSFSKEILCRFPLKDYLKDVNSCHNRGRLTSVTLAKKRSQIFEQIASKYGRHVLSRYLKFALSFFMTDSLRRLNSSKFPVEILRLYHEWFERVLDDFSTQPDKYYDYRCLSFAIDVRVCSLRNIPVGGAWVIETRTIGLRPLLGGGLRQFFKYLHCVSLEAGGLARYYSMHTVPRYTRCFNAQENHLAYLRIADLMKLDPCIKGIYNKSWYLDPNLEKISPKLAYLRQVPLQNAAKLFATGTTKEDIKYALTASFVRQRLHKEGKYEPTTYAFIWPRKKFLDWAETTEVRDLISPCNCRPRYKKEYQREAVDILS